tara:strand:- start:1778 stop:2548 length:771 start_codon:yes stop_codon:yes gene_type:complete
MINKFFSFCFALMLVASCSSKKDILLLQDIDEYPSIDIIETTKKLQPNDILKIKVGALIPDAAIPFNMLSSSGSENRSNTLELMKLEGYLVSSDYTIEFPVLGEISVANKNIDDLQEYIKNSLVDGGYLSNPTVTIRLLNAKFTILGEVNNPGTFSYTDTKISFLQGLGIAGGLTIDADRENLILIREFEGKQKTIHINLTKSDWLLGPYQNLQINDVILVKPSKTKIKSAGFIGNISEILSVASILLSTSIIIFN